MKVNRNKEQIIDHLVDTYFIYNHDTGKIYNKIKRSKRMIKGSVAGFLTKHGYATIVVKKMNFRAHRIAWRLYYGTWPKYQIDHINGNRSDNRICNLRDVTLRENMQNKNIHRNGNLFGSSLEKTVKLFRSQVYIKNKTFFLGYFKTELEAHEQYLRALKVIETRKFKSAKELREYLTTFEVQS